MGDVCVLSSLELPSSGVKCLGMFFAGFLAGFFAEDIRREVEACSRKRNSATLQYSASNRSSYAPSLPEWMGKVMVE